MLSPTCIDKVAGDPAADEKARTAGGGGETERKSALRPCALSTGRAKAARLSDHTLTQTETLAKPQTTPSRNRVITINGRWGVPPGWALYSTQQHTNTLTSTGRQHRPERVHRRTQNAGWEKKTKEAPLSPR